MWADSFDDTSDAGWRNASKGTCQVELTEAGVPPPDQMAADAEPEADLSQDVLVSLPETPPDMNYFGLAKRVVERTFAGVNMWKKIYPNGRDWGTMYKGPRNSLEMAAELGNKVLANPHIFTEADEKLTPVTPEGRTWNQRGYYDRPIGDPKRGQRPDNFRRQRSNRGAFNQRVPGTDWSNAQWSRDQCNYSAWATSPAKRSWETGVLPSPWQQMDDWQQYRTGDCTDDRNDEWTAGWPDDSNEYRDYVPKPAKTREGWAPGDWWHDSPATEKQPSQPTEQPNPQQPHQPSPRQAARPSQSTQPPQQSQQARITADPPPPLKNPIVWADTRSSMGVASNASGANGSMQCLHNRHDRQSGVESRQHQPARGVCRDRVFPGARPFFTWQEDVDFKNKETCMESARRLACVLALHQIPGFEGVLTYLEENRPDEVDQMHKLYSTTWTEMFPKMKCNPREERHVFSRGIIKL